jgi:hypothetical protein
MVSLIAGICCGHFFASVALPVLSWNGRRYIPYYLVRPLADDRHTPRYLFGCSARHFPVTIEKSSVTFMARGFPRFESMLRQGWWLSNRPRQIRGKCDEKVSTGYDWLSFIGHGGSRARR